MKTAQLSRFSIYSGDLILVNKTYPYRENENLGFLMPVNDKYPHILMERKPAVLLDKLMKEIHGWSGIAEVSGHRSFEEQQEIWNSSINESGLEFTKKYVAMPSCSEHQTGLAIDLGLLTDNIDFIRPYFPYFGICQLFRKKAVKYGFIERYSAEKEKITGIAHEPWHFRYVGIPHAEIITEMGFSLEEYHEFLKQFPYGKRPFIWKKEGAEFKVSYLSFEDRDSLSPNFSFSISGNNYDGFVITEYEL